MLEDADSLEKGNPYELNAWLNQEAEVFRYGSVILDRPRFRITVAEKEIPLTLSEFRVFDALLSKPGKVFTREMLLEVITGNGRSLAKQIIDVHVRSIRRKLEKDRSLIETIRGVGYRFKEMI